MREILLSLILLPFFSLSEDPFARLLQWQAIYLRMDAQLDNVCNLNSNGDYLKMEPFMQKTKLAAPIDMELGPDGRLYILEYGTGWYHKNEDASLSRIDFKK